MCVHKQVFLCLKCPALLLAMITSNVTLPPCNTCTGAGVPHIAEQILQSLDVKSLVVSEQVSSTWRDIIGDLRIWKHMIKHKIDSNPLWRGLFKKRGWWVRKRVGTDIPYHVKSHLSLVSHHAVSNKLNMWIFSSPEFNPIAQCHAYCPSSIQWHMNIGWVLPQPCNSKLHVCCSLDMQ